LKVWSLLAVGVGLSLLSATQSAAAQDYETWTPEEQEDRLGVEFNWLNTGRADGTHSNILTWDAFVQVMFNPTLFAVADVPWTYVAVPPNSKFLFGNPMIGLQWADSFADRHVGIFAGAMIGIPVHANPDAEGFVAAERAASIRAYDGFGRFSPRSLPIVIRTGTRLIFAPFFVRIEITPTIFGPLTPNAVPPDLPKVGEEFGLRSDFALQTGSTLVMLDQSNEFGIRASFGLYGGLRFQENFILSGADDIVQLAVEPFIGYEAEKRGFIGRLGFLVALDGQAGFGFDAGKDRLARLMVGYKFD
jgi:hypothetical protein